MQIKIAEEFFDAGSRAHLLNSQAKLIDNAADMIIDIFRKELRKVCYLEQSVLTNIHQKKVAEGGHIVEGSVEWNLQIDSPMYERKMKLAIEMPIIEGILLRPLTFVSSKGERFPLNEKGIIGALRTPDRERRVRWEPGVTRALLLEN